jgi:hypothetical protein
MLDTKNILLIALIHFLFANGSSASTWSLRFSNSTNEIKDYIT